MSSITLNISFNLTSKKFTFAKTTTVHQVADAALEKFGIKNGASGKLLHNEKLLDSSLPLRLTNLTNNSKLKLQLGSAGSSSPVNVKLSASLPEQTKNMISKVDPNLSLYQVLEQFASENSIDLLSKDSRLVVSNTTYESSSYKEKTLRDSAGNVSSLVIRFSFAKSQQEGMKRHQEQQEIIKKHLQMQKERNQKLREEKLQAQQIATEHVLESSSKSVTKDAPVDSAMEDASPEATEVNKPEHSPPENTSAEQATAGSSESLAENETSNPDKFQEPASESPQLYLPQSNASSSYENPDEDYEMTVGQAMSYQKLIQDSARRKPKAVSAPQKYNLRIKFPDRSILQINLLHDVQDIKFGNLLKRIDVLLLEEFVGNYNLKLGYPPFQKISTSFDYNNQLLVNLPEFQSERSVLIWEYKGAPPKNGPFVKSDAIADVKTSSELPEVVLESHRGELPGEAARIEKPFDSKMSEDTKERKGPKVPKWFKTK